MKKFSDKIWEELTVAEQIDCLQEIGKSIPLNILSRLTDSISRADDDAELYDAVAKLVYEPVSPNSLLDRHCNGDKAVAPPVLATSAQRAITALAGCLIDAQQSIIEFGDSYTCDEGITTPFTLEEALESGLYDSQFWSARDGITPITTVTDALVKAATKLVAARG